MATVTFDTHKFVRKLKESGFNDKQAEALTDAVQESHTTAELATKADLRAYDAAIRNDLEKLEINVRHEIDNLRKDIDSKLIDIKFDPLKWMVGLFIAQTGLLLH